MTNQILKMGSMVYDQFQGITDGRVRVPGYDIEHTTSALATDIFEGGPMLVATRRSDHPGKRHRASTTMYEKGSGSGRCLSSLPRPVALVIGGGGALGSAQVGVGLALEDVGFVPDLIVGTSAGALNGVIVAAHPGAAAPWLATVWAHVRRPEILPVRVPWRRGNAGGLLSPEGLRRLIARAALPARLEDLPVPYRAVAMDLVTGEAAVLATGDLESALLASTAIPGLLPPVERDGALLVDGGVVAYVPVVAALEAGAASMVVVTSGPESGPLAPGQPRRRARSIAARSAEAMLHHQIERDLREVSRQVPTVVMPTGIEHWPPPWDFGQSDRLIATARAASRLFLQDPQIEAVAPSTARGGERR